MRLAIAGFLGLSLLATTALAAPRVALLGTVVTPQKVMKSGRIVLDGNTIVCVGSKCSLAGATVVKTGLDLFPGLVDSHNHVSWAIFPFQRFAKPTFNNRYNWRFGDPVFKAMQSAKAQLEKKLKCDLTLYGEVMAALGGTTTIVSEDSCFGTGIRNGESPDLGGPAMKTVQDPLQLRGSSRAFWDQALASQRPSVNRFVIHLAEGRDASSLAEWGKLEAMGAPYTQNRLTSIVHGIPFSAAEYARMAERGWSLIWSPSSNMRLYQRTNDILAALSAGVSVALGPDWNPGGSPTALQELGYVRRLYPSGPVRDALTGPRLLYMVTTAAAIAIGLERYIGTLAPGFRADILGVRRAPGVTDPYENLTRSDPRNVELVVVDGKAVVVSAANQALAGVPLAGACEPVDACGVQRHVCLTTSVTGLISRIRAAYPQVAPLADCSERPLQ
jgi:5-methylthioadenosine/S-adenosylhomocysteine deaminase